MFDIKNKYKSEIFEIIDKYDELSLDSIPKLIKYYKIYCDYDEVLVDLLTPWLEDLNLKNNTFLSESDVNSFFFFDSQPNGFSFLDQKDTYKNVIPREDALPFLTKLKEFNLLDNLFIVTASNREQPRLKRRGF